MLNRIKARTPILALILALCSLGYTFAHNKVVVVPLGGDSLAPSGIFTIQPIALDPLDNDQEYYSQGDEDPGDDSNLDLYCLTGDTGDEFMAPVYLPDGVTITRFDLSGYDASGSARLAAVLGKVCLQNGSAVGNYTALTSEIGTTTGYSGGSNFNSDTTIGEVVDNENCHYHVAVDLAGDSGLDQCAGSQVQFRRARVFWER